MPRVRNNRTTTVRTGSIAGVEELQKLFASVPATLRKSFGPAVRDALKPVADAMRSKLLPRRRTGTLRASIRVRVVTYPGGNVFGVVGPSQDVAGEYRGKLVDPTKYAHLVEFGTRPHALKKKVVGREEVIVEPAGNRKGYSKFRNRYAPVVGARTHPGAKPYPFRGPALAYSSTVLRKIEARIERDLKRSGRDHGGAGLLTD